MKTRLASLAALLLLASTASAGSVVIRMTGTVGTNTITAGPLMGAPSGATAVMTFSVDTPGSPWIGAPLDARDYAIDPGSFTLEAGGAPLGMVPAGQVLRLFDDYAGFDRVQLNLADLEGGLVMSCEVGLPISAFSSTALDQQVGVYTAAEAVSYHWSLNGSGVFIVTFASLEIEQATVGTPFCFGDGSGGVCPCGNLGLPGQGCANSTGGGGVLGSTGTDSATENSVVFDCTGLPPSVSALLFMGTNELPGGVLLGDGLRCVGGQLVRLGVRSTDASGAAAWSSVLGGAGLVAGDRRLFQVWYRDPLGGACGQGFSLSSGLDVTFQ